MENNQKILKPGTGHNTNNYIYNYYNGLYIII